MPFKKITGIYTITNITNGKIYVGYAKSILNRLAVHRNALINNRHKNPYLQSSFNYHGIENFLFEILVECDQEDLASEENYWCNLLNVHNRKYGYNSKGTHPDNINIKSVECRKKTSESLKKYYADRPQLVADFVERMKTVDFKKVAATKVWTEEGLKALSESAKKRGVAHLNTKEVRERSSPKTPVLQFDLQGNFIKEYESILAAHKETGIRKKGISSCSNESKPNKIAGGFTWKRKNNNVTT